MEFKYQLIIIGYDHKFKNRIIETFRQRVKELCLQDDLIGLFEGGNFFSNYISNSPSVCLYFGGDTGNFPNLDILDKLIKNTAFILPVVNDLTNFPRLVPEQLRPINGFELADESKIEALVSSILEAFNLLRSSRRLFISYKRKESRSIAIQLYEDLDARGFDVFLDTHSIRPGEPFQDELWQRMVDTEVVVLLDTPEFLKSKWTKEELIKASALSIQILQLIWPDNYADNEYIRNDDYSLCYPKYLKKEEFENNSFQEDTSRLKENAIEEISSLVESLRARGLAARQNNLIKEFVDTAKALKISADLQPEKFITFVKNNGEAIAVIPTIGVPQAFTYNQSEELIKKVREHNTPQALLIYDHRNIRDKWLQHLDWLNKYLPIKTVRITNIEAWMQNV